MISDCLFCRLQKTKHAILFENEHLVVLDDIAPQAPVHQLIIPRQHIETLNHLTLDQTQLVGHMIYTAKEQAKKLKIQHDGFRLILNCNQNAGQTVNHIHLHLLGGRILKWPPG